MTALVVVGALVGALGAILLAAMVTVAEAADVAQDDLDTLHGAGIAFMIVAAVTSAAVAQWWQRPLMEAIGVAIATGGFVMVAGGLLPRALADAAPRLVALVGPVALQAAAALRPLQTLARTTERALERLLPADAAPAVDAGRPDMVDGVLSLREETVADVMTPRLDIEGIDVTLSWPQVVEVLRHGDHARLPAYGEDLDDLVGILHARDLTGAVAGVAPPPDRWQDLLRRPHYVPESKLLTVQLRDFQRGTSHLAVVVDEFGGTAGVVTLEDVLEEVVGEIRGEYDDEEEAPYRREGEDRFWVNGAMTLDELESLLGVALVQEDVTTVGGLVYSELGRVPEPGEELVIGPFRVVVERVVQRRVRTVYFERRVEDVKDGTDGGDA